MTDPSKPHTTFEGYDITLREDGSFALYIRGRIGRLDVQQGAIEQVLRGVPDYIVDPAGPLNTIPAAKYQEEISLMNAQMRKEKP